MFRGPAKIWWGEIGKFLLFSICYDILRIEYKPSWIIIFDYTIDRTKHD